MSRPSIAPGSPSWSASPPLVFRLVLAACLTLALPVGPARVALAQGTGRVTHGPMLGRLSSDAVGVWVRTSQPGAYRVWIGTEQSALRPVVRPIVTRLERDNTGWVLVDGLASDTRYRYVVGPAAAGVAPAGPGGTFRTLPSSELLRDEQLNPRGLFNFRFQVGSCANQSEHSVGAELPVYQTLLRDHVEDVHFSILNGDWVYEEQREFTIDQWLAQVSRQRGDLPPLVRMALGLTGVWENYKLYLERGVPLAEWHRHVPSYFTFDDHEILNDVVGTGTTGFRGRRTVFRDIALRGWYDYLGWSNPVSFEQDIQFGRAQLTAGSDVLVDEGADFTRLDLAQAANLHVHWGRPDQGVDDQALDAGPGDPNSAVYAIAKVLDEHRLRIEPAAVATGSSTYSIGRLSYFKQRVANCDFYYLDTRTHRQKHDIRDPRRADVSMLGQQQKDWLRREMAASDADLFFIVSTVPFTIPHVGAGGMAFAAEDKDDAWTAFLHDREELIEFWDSLGRPVLVLTGDLHNSFAVRVTDRVWEFCCGPHNSANHPLASEGNRPTNGLFDSRGRECDIQWSSFVLDDVPLEMRRRPLFCIMQVNNVFDSPSVPGQVRWVAYNNPQVVVQYYDGRTGELLYAQSLVSRRE